MPALSGTHHTLEGACRRLGVPLAKAPVAYGRLDGALVDYLCEDVRATAELYHAIQPEIERHAGAGVPAHKLFSPASLARGYLRATGIDRAPAIDPQVAAWGAAAFTGGRIEARIVRCEVPVVVGDRSAAYVRDAAALGIDELLAAERLGTRDAKNAFVRFLAGGDLLGRTADLAVCRRLGRMLVEVRPRGESWQVRAWFADRSAPSLTTAPSSSTARGG